MSVQGLWGAKQCPNVPVLACLLSPLPRPLQVEAAAKNKPQTSYDTVAQLLARKPHPVKAPGLEELQEAAAAAAAWRTKYYKAIGLPAAAAAAAAGVSIAATAAAAAVDHGAGDAGVTDSVPDAAADAGGEEDETAAAAAAAAAAERRAAAEAEAAAAAAAAAAARIVNTRAAAIAAVSAAFAGCSGGQHASAPAAAAGREEGFAAAPVGPTTRVPSQQLQQQQPSAALAAAAAAAAAAFAGKHFDVRALTDLADEVVDVGLELPEQQLLRERLDEGAALQDQITEVLAAEGDDRYDVHTLRGLQQQASSCGLALQGACEAVWWGREGGGWICLSAGVAALRYSTVFPPDGGCIVKQLHHLEPLATCATACCCPCADPPSSSTQILNPPSHTGLDRLAAAIEAGEVLTGRLHEALQTRAPLEDLQALADEAAQLPVYVADIDTVHSLLGKAQEWLRKANHLASQVGRGKFFFAQ